MIHPTAFIHPKAHVEDAEIGPQCRVWQFASVIRGAVLGPRCSVGSSATLDGAKFGADCVISPGVDIGPGFQVGDNVFIGPNVVLCNDAWPTAHKQGFDAEALVSGALICVVVEDGASLGAGAVVLPGVRIGAGAMVAANATVTADVPAGHLWTRAGDIRPVPQDAWKRRMREA